MDSRLLNKELADLRDQIRHNEKIWDGFRLIELNILGARTLSELVEVLAKQLQTRFANVDCVSLTCFDPEYEMIRLLERGGDGGIWRKIFSRAPDEALADLFADFDGPVLGRCTPYLKQLLFPSCPLELGSFAAAPLWFQGQLIGSLNQGSRHVRHFSAEAATDLLEHLAAVVAVCIDNAILHARLRHAGITDALTGLFNRGYFDRRLKEEVDRWARHTSELACMLIDIDKFKQINDQHGHQTGDKVLQWVAQLLASDLRGSDVLARYGGEEFVMLLPDTSLRVATEIAERLRQDVENFSNEELADKGLAVTVSIGVACLGSARGKRYSEAASCLVRSADIALYEAKDSGRNRVIVSGTDCRT